MCVLDDGWNKDDLITRRLRLECPFNCTEPGHSLNGVDLLRCRFQLAEILVIGVGVDYKISGIFYPLRKFKVTNVLTRFVPVTRIPKAFL